MCLRCGLGALIAVVAALVFAGAASSEASVTVTLAGTGSGRVVGTATAPPFTPTLIDCPDTCSIQVGTDLVVALSATPAAGSEFTGWSVPEWPQVAPPNPLYVPVPSIVSGCGSSSVCTVRVASSPDFYWPGCGVTPNCLTASFADLPVVATFAQAPARVSDTFLCYSRYPGSIPGVWPLDRARTMLAESTATVGYWIPIAVPGNDRNGNNVGRYHLVCNAGVLTPRGIYTNTSGDTINSSDAAVIKADRQSDLNVFSVYG
jgi:hypothetical protein